MSRRAHTAVVYVFLGFLNVIGTIGGLLLYGAVVNEELNYAVAVGSAPRNDSCGAGLIFFDLSDPSNPTRMGCDGSDGYVHDAQCLVYRGPDVKYQGRDICYGYNEDTLTIYDVTDKKASKVISRTSVSTLSLSVYMYVADNSSSTRELPTLIKDGSTTRTGKSSSSSTMRLMRRNSPAQLLINTP